MFLLRWALRLAALVVVIVGVYFAVTFVQVWAATGRDHTEPAEAIVVLGAAQYGGQPSGVLQARLDHAFDLYQQGLAPVIVLTGGRLEGDQFSEASAGESYLLAKGVPEADLLLESGGRSTWESLSAAANFLLPRGITDVILVSSPYHALRTERIAAEVGLEGHASPTRSEREGIVGQFRHLVRETVAVGVGRIIGYRHLVQLEERLSE